MLNSISEEVKQLITARRKTNASSGWISFNAPCCVHNGETADSRGRGGIVANGDGGISYHCFNCGFKSSYVPGRHLTYKFRKLLRWLGADENTVRRLVIEAIRVRELDELTKPEESNNQTDEPVTYRPRPLPSEAVSFYGLVEFYELANNHSYPQQFVDAVSYVNQRSIDMKRYDFYWTPQVEHKLNYRVIVPFTWNNEIIGYSARTFVNGIKPKYYTEHEPDYVFNVDRQQKDSKFVIVVEGAFDAMSIDGVAVLSNECNERQADIIDSLGKEVIVVPDFDRHTNNQGRSVWPGSRLVDCALEYGWSVSFPVWRETCKDVNEAVVKYGNLFVLKSIIDAKEHNRLKIEIMKRKIANE